MAVFLEPPETLLGLRGAIEHYVERTQPEGARSGPGDLDLVAYSLHKWLRLALSGNPTVLLLLFTPPEHTLLRTPRGQALQALAPAIVSQRAGPRYVGYLRAQKERLLGTRGQRRVNRPELIEAHGFDTKYAMHVLRLGEQGIELMQTGRLTLPMPEPSRSRVMAVRAGDVRYDETVEAIEEVERRLGDAVATSPLQAQPDHDRVQRFVLETYREFWGW